MSTFLGAVAGWYACAAFFVWHLQRDAKGGPATPAAWWAALWALSPLFVLACLFCDYVALMMGACDAEGQDVGRRLGESARRVLVGPEQAASAEEGEGGADREAGAGGR